MLTGIIGTLIAAAIIGITGYAFKKPSEYEKIVWYLIGFITLVFFCFSIWDNAINLAETQVFKIGQFDNRDLVINAIEGLRTYTAYSIPIWFGIIFYLILILMFKFLPKSE